MIAKIILAVVSLSIAVATLQPVLAGPKASATGKQTVVSERVGVAPIRGDLHVYLKAF